MTTGRINQVSVHNHSPYLEAMESTGPLSKGPKTPFLVGVVSSSKIEISGFLNASHYFRRTHCC